MGNVLAIMGRLSWVRSGGGRIRFKGPAFCALALLSLCAVVWPRQADGQCASLTTLTNGMVADASQVMNNFTAVNNGCAPIASPRFTGDVGIGTTTPDGALEVAAPDGGSAFVTSNTSGTPRFFSRASDGICQEVANAVPLTCNR